jgi:hypothetical protein
MPSKPPPRQESPRRSEASTPSENAEFYQHPADQSWSLQILLDVKGALGEIKEAVRTLQKTSDNPGDKLDSISHQIYAAWAVLVVIIVVGGFLLDKFWGPLTKLFEQAAKP